MPGRRARRFVGLRQLWFRGLGEVGYRRQLVTELRLPAGPVGRWDVPGAKGRFLGSADLAAYTGLHGSAADARRRFARGERCFGVWLDGRLVSTRWIATGTAHIDYLRRDVTLAAGDVYIYETYTAPAQRRRGVGAVAACVLPPTLAAEGVHRIVGVLEPENAVAIRVNEQAGYRIVGRIGYVKLGPWRRDFGGLS